MQNKLVKIQSELKAPKGQNNTFGNYKYRSCEDILVAVKPLLTENGLILLLSDEVVCVGSSNYIKATARLTDDKDMYIETTAFAREAEDQKGMSPSQITGSTSSYARKYALNGLFAIDDTKDADTQDNTKYVTAFKVVDTSGIVALGKLLEGKGIEDKEDRAKILVAMAGGKNLTSLDGGEIATMRKEIMIAGPDTLRTMLDMVSER